ncbi:winged helix-turn-helix transcriptional regulator [Kineobactrum salinum]|uniref:Helix-turn-helix transcriptional regulator n=1 Tax=Kineobactrum salinum TaxID=2708301 RepID=A0A6C0TZK9_9GAMM|nr:helix-turn-helix domain-containing protein [Kineobactrum salinum]QIB65272.1 helix-turn-helix transcriptional regulator [Kineobactrum salinum]
MTELKTRASSINRALDQIGDKWCILIIQEVFWGINSFGGMLEAIGVSRGVLSNRLKWLQSMGCLRRHPTGGNARHPVYHLTRKSIDLYHTALMAVVWEEHYHPPPPKGRVQLLHRSCGHSPVPTLRCSTCRRDVRGQDVSYHPGPGATRDVRDKKVRRRSSLSVDDVPSERSVYRNLIGLVGDRWTANVIALAFHGLQRFDEFHRELPVATNILSDRMQFLVRQGVFATRPYQQRPVRHLYELTDKGWDLFPYFLTLLQWGDKWCDRGAGRPLCLTHELCGESLHGEVVCNHCGEELRAHHVDFSIGPMQA